MQQIQPLNQKPKVSNNLALNDCQRCPGKTVFLDSSSPSSGPTEIARKYKLEIRWTSLDRCTPVCQ